jgi:hypothetical protein
MTLSLSLLLCRCIFSLKGSAEAVLEATPLFHPHGAHGGGHDGGHAGGGGPFAPGSQHHHAPGGSGAHSARGSGELRTAQAVPHGWGGSMAQSSHAPPIAMLAAQVRSHEEDAAMRKDVLQGGFEIRNGQTEIGIPKTEPN